MVRRVLLVVQAANVVATSGRAPFSRKALATSSEAPYYKEDRLWITRRSR